MRPLDAAAALAAILIWALNFVVGKVGVSQLPPLTLMTLRFALVALLLAPFLRAPRAPWRLVGTLALVFGFGHFALLFAGLRGVDAAVAAIAVQLGVPFSAALAFVFRGERLRAQQLAGMAIAFSGVGLLAGEPRGSTSLPHLLMLVGSALGWAAGAVVLRRLGHVSPLVLNAWVSWLALPLFAAASLLLEVGQLEAIAAADWRAWGALVYMSLGASITAYGLWYRLLGRYEVSRLVPLTLLAPVLGALFAAALLGDALTARRVAGGLLTTAGVAMIELLRAGR